MNVMLGLFLAIHTFKGVHNLHVGLLLCLWVIWVFGQASFFSWMNFGSAYFSSLSPPLSLYLLPSSSLFSFYSSLFFTSFSPPFFCLSALSDKHSCLFHSLSALSLAAVSLIWVKEAVTLSLWPHKHSRSPNTRKSSELDLSMIFFPSVRLSLRLLCMNTAGGFVQRREGAALLLLRAVNKVWTDHQSCSGNVFAVAAG